MRKSSDRGSVLPNVIFIMAVLLIISAALSMSGGKGLNEAFEIRKEQQDKERTEKYFNAAKKDHERMAASDIWFSGSVIKKTNMLNYIFLSDRSAQFQFEITNDISETAYISIIREGSVSRTLATIEKYDGTIIPVIRDTIYMTNSRIDSFITRQPLTRGRYRIITRQNGTGSDYSVVVRLFFD